MDQKLNNLKVKAFNLSRDIAIAQEQYKNIISDIDSLERALIKEKNEKNKCEKKDDKDI